MADLSELILLRRVIYGPSPILPGLCRSDVPKIGRVLRRRARGPLRHEFLRKADVIRYASSVGLTVDIDSL